MKRKKLKQTKNCDKKCFIMKYFFVEKKIINILTERNFMIAFLFYGQRKKLEKKSTFIYESICDEIFYMEIKHCDENSKSIFDNSKYESKTPKFKEEQCFVQL